jgi:hypothetical protein
LLGFCQSAALHVNANAAPHLGPGKLLGHCSVLLNGHFIGAALEVVDLIVPSSELRLYNRTMVIIRPKWAAIITALLGSSLIACAAHREANRAAERKEQEELAQAQAKVHACIVNFVLTSDSPRLTGFELADAAVAACAQVSETLRHLAIEQDELSPRQINALVEGNIKSAQREALAALAMHDRNPAPAPVKSIPLPTT